jgi:hypothetical protein
VTSFEIFAARLLHGSANSCVSRSAAPRSTANGGRTESSRRVTSVHSEQCQRCEGDRPPINATSAS